MRKLLMIVSLCMMTMATCFAQTPAAVQAKIDAIMKKFEDTKGVESTTVARGSGLGLVKMMLSAESGSDFTKGVTKINIIEYSEASQATCDALHKEFEGFKTLLDDITDEGDQKDHTYFASYGNINVDERTMSDLILIMEDKESKMFLHLAGKIKIDNL